jgi:hypothetical protein
MNKLLYWLKALPTGLAIKIRLYRTFTKWLKIPVGFYFSQTGEDIIIHNYFGEVKDGFYVDAGCHEPIKWSNTFKLYLQGWTGINIDADSSMMVKVSKTRKLDINICAALSDSVKKVTFYKSATSPAVNTVSRETYDEWKLRWDFDDKDREELMTTTLTKILEQHLPTGKKIDLLSVDVEGHKLETFTQGDLYQHLTDNHYKLIGFATMNVYFRDIK